MKHRDKLSIVILLSCSPALFAQVPEVTRFSLSPEGFVTTWLVRGPFSDEGRSNRDVDFLRASGGEAAAPTVSQLAGGAVASGDPGDDSVWRLDLSSRYYVDFLPVMRPTEDAIGYAMTWLESSKQQEVIVKLGSDDGVKMWLNGELVHDNPAYRGMTADDDVVPLQLSAGINAVLIKVNQGVGDWRFCFRVTTPEDKPASNLTVLLPRLIDDAALRRFAATSFRVRTLLSKQDTGKLFRFSLARDAGVPELDAEFVVLGTVTDVVGRPISEVFRLSTSNDEEEAPSTPAVWKPGRLAPGMYVLETRIYESQHLSEQPMAITSKPIFWY